MKTLFIRLSCCFLSTVGLVFFLYMWSRTEKNESGNFLRVYSKGAAIRSNDMNLGFNSWYVAGITAEHVYLGNLTTPLRILVVNHTLTDSQHIWVQRSKNEQTQLLSNLKFKVVDSNFYYIDGYTPCLFQGRLGDWFLKKTKYDSVCFDYMEIIDTATFAIKGRTKSQEILLGLVQKKPLRVTSNRYLLNKKIDGIFCTDGIMRYNRHLQKLIYIYHYRNEYFTYDKLLSNKRTGKSIDTFSFPRIRSSRVSSNNSFVLTSRKYVNNYACTSGRYLFIQSNVIAKNDIKSVFDKTSVIDVYDLVEQKYQFSFALPHEPGNTQFMQFEVYNNKFLIVISGNYIIRYDLKKTYLKDLS